LAGCTPVAGGAGTDDGTKTLGIVALIANDALNVAVINGATKAAEDAGWNVKVTDTQASADQANAAMTTYATQGVDAIFVLAFASSAIGSGLAAANSASIPVATWGGEIVDGIVVTTSGRTVGEDSVEELKSVLGDSADILALTFHPGKLCLDRGAAFEDGVADVAGFDVTSNEVTVPGQVEDGTSFANAWLAGHPKGSGNLAIWSCWDDPMSGAVAAVKANGRDDVTTISIGGVPAAIQSVIDGDLYATVWQPAYDEGIAVFGAITDSIEAGDSWEPTTIELPGVVITKDTVDQFLADHPDALN
jgi:ribose transport system substrate-binding protein